MKGRRTDPTPNRPFDMEPGDYYLAPDRTAVGAKLPNGAYIRVNTHLHTDPTRPRWDLKEHEDGSLTLHPSINLHPTEQHEGWHGWLRAGEWIDA